LGKAYLIGPGKVLTEISNNQQDDNLNGISDEDYGLHANRRQSKVDLVSGAISEIVLPPVHYVDYIALAAANPTGIPASVAAGSLAFDPLVINQTLYPMIDERRDDGTDNNGNEDGDGRALDATDVRESDQIGLTSFAIGTNGSFQLNLNNIRSEFYARSIPGTFDATTNQIPSSDYMYGTGYFPLAAGQTERFSIALVYGTSAQDVLDNKDIVQQIYDANYNFVRPPTPPTLKVSTDDRRVTLYWDTVAEDYRDEFIRRRLDLPANTNDPRVRNFEGYKILRSTDNNFLDAFTLVGSEGQQGIQPKPVATFDLVNEVSGNFPLNTASLLKQSKGIAYYLGNNSGLQHRFTDTTVVNGKTYFYAVIAYSRGDTGLQIYPPYNSASARSDGRGNYTLGSNVVVVTPAAKTAGYANAAGRQGNLTPAGGPGGQALPVGQGGVSYAVVDAKNLQNKTYRVEFSDIGSDTVDNDGNGKTDGNDLGERVPLTSFYRVLDVTNPAAIDTLIRRNRRPLFTAGSYTELAPNLFGYNGDDEIFDGLYLSLQNELKSIYLPEKSGWTRGSGTDTINAYTVSMKPADSIAFNVVRAVVDSIPIPDDFEIELVETDAATGVAKSDTMKYLQRRTNAVQPPLVLTANGLPVNFRIKNLTTGKPVRFLVLPQATTGGGGVVIGSNTFNIIKICLSANSAVPASGIDTVYSWLLTFAPTSAANRVAPRAGDKFTFRTSKPFRTGDAFTFTTAVPDVSSERAKSVLDRIRVVPNPYIARSAFEPALPAGTTSGRGERRVYFTRVPKESTIRIYSVRGDLIRTLKQDGTDNGQVLWDLRSSEGLDIAFGLYLYHLDAPGVGTTTGKLVLIK
ncbi:MAG: hypothetical protein IAF08_00235, partial [Rhizobacter sp.]|nr:hypothetical protein [Chlorobiales bacterium]